MMMRLGSCTEKNRQVSRHVVILSLLATIIHFNIQTRERKKVNKAQRTESRRPGAETKRRMKKKELPAGLVVVVSLDSGRRDGGGGGATRATFFLSAQRLA